MPLIRKPPPSWPKGFTRLGTRFGVVVEEYGVGLDLGATRLRACVGDRKGRLLWRKSERMVIPGKVEEYVGQIIASAREAIRHAPSTSSLVGIGVASVGPLDLKKGGMAKPANLPYEFVPLVGPLRTAFGMDVALMNDANAAALGERSFGAGKGHENLVYVTISTGIGGGAIVDGHLLSGKDGNAAEIGHVTVDPVGRLTCGCGKKGHWEAYCSGRSIPKLAMLVAGEGPTAGAMAGLRRLLQSKTGEVGAPAVLDAATRGDPLGKRIAAEMGRLNAMGFANAINLFDPSLITVGGGVALNNRALVLNPIRKTVSAYTINRVPKIMITPLGDDAGLLGAVSLALGASVS